MFPTGLFCFVFSSAVAPLLGLKTWIPSTNVEDKRNWNVLDLPRNCDEISFDVRNDLTVFWSMEDLIVTGLGLPMSGILSFPNDMSIELKDRALCPGARVMKYVRDEWKGWLDPFNWESHSDGMWLPHAMRIPCSGEDVKFPAGNNLAVQLPEIKVFVGKIYLGDEEFDGDDWSEFLNTERGKSMFRSEEITQEPWLHDAECAGQRNCSCGKTSYVYQNSFRAQAYRWGAGKPSSFVPSVSCIGAQRSLITQVTDNMTRLKNTNGHSMNGSKLQAFFSNKITLNVFNYSSEQENATTALTTDDILTDRPGKKPQRSPRSRSEITVVGEEPGKRKHTFGLNTPSTIARGYRSVPTEVLHQAVCLYARPKCQPSGCYSPVIPEGHCCGICGAVIKVRETGRGDRVLNQILDMMRNIKMDMPKTVQYYVGRTTDENIEIVVLADSSDHTSDSLTSSALIKDYLTERKFSVMSEKLSGPTLSGYFLKSPPGIAFGTFLAVAFFYGAIYFVYVILPEKNLTKITKQPFGFARFRNVLQEAGSEEKLEIGTEPEEHPRESSQGFHNPTFSDNSVAATSRMRGGNVEGAELEMGQEYNNPTYDEMEKTRELLGGEDAGGEIEKLQGFSEIDL